MYKNPFVYKRPLDPERDQLVWIERKTLLQKALSSLEFGEWLSVCCARRSGKTSFILRVISEFSKRHPDTAFIMIRPEDFSSYTVAEFAHLILKRTTPYLTAPAGEEVINPDESITSILSRLACELAPAQRFIVSIDGIESAPKRFATTVIHELVTLFHAKSVDRALQRFQFIVAGSLAPRELRLENGTLFTEYATSSVLDDFAYEDVDAMLHRVCEANHIEMEAGFTRLMYEYTFGTGFLIQKICYRILENSFLRGEPLAFTLQQGEESMSSILRDGDTGVQMMLQQIEKQNGLIEKLLRLMREGTIKSNRYDSDLYELVTIGAVSKRNDRFRIRNMIVERFCRDYFTSERLANRFRSPVSEAAHYQEELLLETIAQQADAENAITNLHNTIKALDEQLHQPDYWKHVLQMLMATIEGAQSSALFFLDQKTRTLFIKEAIGLAPEFAENFELKMGEGVAGLVAMTGRSRVVRDVTDEVECPDFVARDFAIRANIGSMIALPLRTARQVFGVINICLKKPHEFSRYDISMLEIIALHLSLSFDHKSSLHAVERQQDYHAILQGLVHKLDVNVDAHSILASVLEAAQQITALPNAYLVWKSAAEQEWQILFPPGYAPERVAAELRRGEGIASKVLNSGMPCWGGEAQNGHPSAMAADRMLESAVPFRVDGEPVGCIVLTNSGHRPMQELHKNLLLTLATIAGLAIKKQRLYHIAERNTQQVISLKYMGAVGSDGTAEDELLDSIAKECLNVLNRAHKAAAVLLPDKKGNKLVVRSSRGDAFGKKEIGKSIALDESTIVTWVYRHRRPRYAGDVRLDREYHEIYPAVKSEIAVPLILHDRVIGVLDVQSTERNAFDAQDQEALLAVANSASVAITVGQSFGARMRELQALYATGLKINSGKNISQMVRAICSESLNAVGSGSCCSAIHLFHADDSSRCKKYVLRADADKFDFSAGPWTPEPALEFVRTQKRHMIYPDLEQNREYVPEVEEARSALLVPITYDNRCLGIISVESSVVDDFGEIEKKLVTSLAAQAGVAISNARLSHHVAEMQMQLSRALESAAVEVAMAGLAHDIKNISTVIAGETQWLRRCEQEERVDTEAIKSAVYSIETNLQRMNELATGLQNRSYSLPPEFKTIRLQNLLDDLIDLVSTVASRAQVEIVKKQLPPSLTIQADIGRLSRACFNIMTNAIDAMPDGGTLQISVRNEADAIAIAFIDSGAGIPRDQLNKIFKPFATNKKNGYGIGLAITKRIVEIDHGGQLRVTSKAGKGTTVTIRLPKRQAVAPGGASAAVPEEQRRQRGAAAASGTAAKQQTVLVVNDEKAMLDKIKRKLVGAGFAVSATQYGRHAVRLCRKKQFDSILLDFHLKKDSSETGTAPDFIPEIRRTQPSTPIILTSASLQPKRVPHLDFDCFLEINAGFWDKVLHVLQQHRPTAAKTRKKSVYAL